MQLVRKLRTREGTNIVHNRTENILLFRLFSISVFDIMNESFLVLIIYLT